MTSPTRTSLVDPFHAVDGGGNCLPGPCHPFGLIRPGPDTVNHNTSGYATGEDIRHFSHTHVSGTGGAGRYGNIGVVPMIQDPDSRTFGFASTDEEARPGYYAVTLRPKQGFGEMANEGSVRAELTASPRCAIHRYRWSAGTESWVRVAVGASIAGSCLHGHARWADDRTLLCSGTFSGGWGHRLPWEIHARLEFSEPVVRTRVLGSDVQPCAHTGAWLGSDIQLAAQFAKPELEVRIALSYVSPAQAARNGAEVAGRSFAETETACAAAWEQILSRMDVKGGSPTDRQLWHTLMMRLFTMPGDHGVDEVPWLPVRHRHFNDLYCLWDSVRCANSLFTLLDRSFAVDLTACLTEIGEQTGWIPDAWVAGASAQVQGGCSAAVLFTEAAEKSLPGFDAPRALAALLRTTETPSPDPWLKGRYPGYAERGYLPEGVINCASRTIEYAFHDHCAARLARSVGDTATAERLQGRADRLWESWHEERKCFAPRRADGSWADFDPWRPACRDFWNDPHFYEGTAHDYAITGWHAIPELVRRHGGPAAFAEYLEEAHARVWFWKEINLHLPWLFHFAGQPHRGAELLRATMDRLVRPGRHGLADNEDMGAWASWWLCGAMGLFPIPSTALWLIGVPRFPEIVIHTPGMTQPFVVTTRGEGVIVRASLNGRPLHRSWLDHQEIWNGGTLELDLDLRPASWGTEPLTYPVP